MITDDSNAPPPVRILCTNGVFSPDAPDEIRQRYSAPRDCGPETNLRTFYMAKGRTGHTPQRAVKERIRYAQLKPQPKRAMATPSKRVRRGKAWNVKDLVTAERILALQAEGLNTREIGDKLECSRDTILGRLRSLRRSQSQLAAITCECGRRKWAKNKRCQQCSFDSMNRDAADD